jgi:uncharacterized protein (UPF0335 family)
MILVLKKGASKKEIKAIERKIYKDATTVGFDAKKYNGVLTLKEDPMGIQTKLRNEWKRD